MENSWVPVVGWEGFYEVSSWGEVRSVDRVVLASHPTGAVLRRRFVGRVLRATPTPKGYPTVKLTRPGVAPATAYVHDLVTAAFIGPKPDGLEVCHGDGDPSHNAPCNLRYDTRSANARDRVAHGRIV